MQKKNSLGVGDYVYDGSHIMRALGFVPLEGGVRAVVGRWVTKTDKLYAQGPPYMVLPHNIIFATESLEDMRRMVEEASSVACEAFSSLGGTNAQEDGNKAVEGIFIVRKTTVDGGVRKTKIVGVYKREEDALAEMRKVVGSARRQADWDGMRDYDGGRYKSGIIADTKRIIVEVTPHNVK